MENKKKGMLFGKMNIIDLIIIIVVLCALGFLASRFLGVGKSAAVQAKTLRVVFYSEETPDFVPRNTKVGDSVFDVDNRQAIGRVTDIQTADSFSYMAAADGSIHRGPKAGYVSVNITMEVSGTPTDYGVVVGSIQYAVGHSIVIYAGMGKYYGRIYSIEAVS